MKPYFLSALMLSAISAMPQVATIVHEGHVEGTKSLTNAKAFFGEQSATGTLWGLTGTTTFSQSGWSSNASGSGSMSEKKGTPLPPEFTTTSNKKYAHPTFVIGDKRMQALVVRDKTTATVTISLIMLDNEFKLVGEPKEIFSGNMPKYSRVSVDQKISQRHAVISYTVHGKKKEGNKRNFMVINDQGEVVHTASADWPEYSKDRPYKRELLIADDGILYGDLWNVEKVSFYSVSADQLYNINLNWPDFEPNAIVNVERKNESSIYLTGTYSADEKEEFRVDGFFSAEYDLKSGKVSNLVKIDYELPSRKKTLDAFAIDSKVIDGAGVYFFACERAKPSSDYTNIKILNQGNYGSFQLYYAGFDGSKRVIDLPVPLMISPPSLLKENLIPSYFFAEDGTFYAAYVGNKRLNDLDADKFDHESVNPKTVILAAPSSPTVALVRVDPNGQRHLQIEKLDAGDFICGSYSVNEKTMIIPVRSAKGALYGDCGMLTINFE